MLVEFVYTLEAVIIVILRIQAVIDSTLILINTHVHTFKKVIVPMKLAISNMDSNTYYIF